MSPSQNNPIISDGVLTPQPLDAVPQFNWIFLVELIVSGILTVFFLFYFNRLFATLVSYGIRAYTLRRYRVYIDIQALQISFLTGRLFFKGIRYHGENETILVQTGHITWRYWSWSVPPGDLLRENDTASINSSEASKNRPGVRTPTGNTSGIHEKSAHIKNDVKLSSRIEVTLRGLEWYVYNRTAAYDALLSDFYQPGDENKPSGTENNGKGQNEAVVERDGDENLNYVRTRVAPTKPEVNSDPLKRSEPEGIVQTPASSSSPSISPSGTDEPESSIPAVLALLPIAMICEKGGIALGNENTKSILTISFDKAEGKIDAKRCGPLDCYQQIFEYDLSHPVVQLKRNPDFKQSQSAAASGSYMATPDFTPKKGKRGFHWRFRHHQRKVRHNLLDMIPFFKSSIESFRFGTKSSQGRVASQNDQRYEDGWIGLSRYIDEEDQDEHEGWNSVDYGRFSTLLDCPSIKFCYYWDIAGKVPNSTSIPSSRPKLHAGNINNAEPPKWGMDLVIRGGIVNYGPWADRERAHIQSIFFPNSYRDAQIALMLKPGQDRQSTEFKLKVEIHDSTTIRIPTREPSKDWQWKGRAETVKGCSRLKQQKKKDRSQGNHVEGGGPGPDIRPFGWLSLRLSGGSSIEYSMDMFASASGYSNTLRLDLQDTTMATSVNHEEIWRCGSQTIFCDLSNPLGWNALHSWSVNVENERMELFLLRDHVFLLNDLISDWGSGPPQDFYTFVPFKYNLSLSFLDLRLFLNVNDSNIINTPADLDENAYLIIEGEKVSTQLSIPMIRYKPNCNSVDFGIGLSNPIVRFSTPLWNTQRTFMHSDDIASLETLEINGGYTYHVSTSPSLTDVLNLTVSSNSPRLYLYGFLVKYFLNVKDNYFGDHLHFKTLEEFQELLHNPKSSKESPGTNPSPKSNNLDVILHVTSSNATILLPTNLYEKHDCLAIEAASLDADLRFTNYYMDLDVSFSPLELSLQSENPTSTENSSGTQVYVDGLEIYGHRLFGLPPTEPTYVCNWDFQIGDIIGECSPSFLKSAKSALTSFIFSIDDEENALPPLNSAGIYDVVFLRAIVQSVRVWVLVDQAAFLFNSGRMDVLFDDWCRSRFSQSIRVTLPDLAVAAVDSASAGRYQHDMHHAIATHAYFRTTVKVNSVGRKENFIGYRTLQQHHIRIHDYHSQRTPWLLHGPPEALEILIHNQRAPVMPVPFMPEPVQFPLASKYSSSNSTPTIISKTSFDTEGQNRSPDTQDDHLSDIRPSLFSTTGPEIGMDRTFSARSRKTDASYQGSTRVHDTHNIQGDRSARAIPTSWAMPNFYFYNVQPDERHVPSISMSHAQSQNIDWEEDTVASTFPEADQVFLSCNLEPGLTGFCTPKAITALCLLLEALQPTDPVDILDELQSDVIPVVLKRNGASKDTLKILSLYLRLPICRIRILSSSSPLEASPPGTFRDQYDFDAINTRVVVRQKSSFDSAEPKPMASGITAHLLAGLLSVSARGEQSDGPGQMGFCVCKIHELVFWAMAENSVKTRIQFNSFDTVSSDESVEGLVLLIGRAIKTTDSISCILQSISEQKRRRLQSLVYQLTKCGSQTPEPLFLTRPSYALRAAREHLRLNDSWKIISRLRNIYKSITSNRQQALRADCINNMLIFPSDAKTTVLSSFDKWRTWDLAHVKKSLVMNVIWNDTGHLATTHSKVADVSISILARSISLSLDPGPKENNFLVDNWSSTIGFQRAFDGHAEAEKLTVQSHCSSASLNLKWELCELIEGLLNTTPGNESQTQSDKPVSLSEEVRTNAKPELHFISVVDSGAIVLDGINLKLLLLGESLTSSITHRLASTNVGEVTDVLLTSKVSSAQFFSRSKPLMSWNFHDPTIFLSHSSLEVKTHFDHDWKFAAICKQLRYEVMEDPLGLIQVADRVVEDEIQYILGFVRSMSSSSCDIPDTRSISSHEKSVHRFHIATFLEDYEINLALLPSLVYSISGDVARLSVSPLGLSKFEIDYDIKNNDHTLHSKENGKRRVLSTLTIPPINGRVLLDTSQDRLSIDIETTIELIRLEASTVRSMLSAVNGPEVSHYFSDLTNEWSILKSHQAQIISRNGAGSPRKRPRRQGPAYQLRATFAGVEIHASAPALREIDYSADMTFKLGIVQVHVQSSPPQELHYDYPEFRMYMSQIHFEIQKRGRQHIQSTGRLILGARFSGTSKTLPDGRVKRLFNLSSTRIDVGLSADTASMIVDISGHLQQTIKTIDLSQEIKHLRKLRLLSSKRKKRTEQPNSSAVDPQKPLALLDATYSVDLANIQVAWLISNQQSQDQENNGEDLVFSVTKIELTTARDNAARLRIQDMQLQMVPLSDDKMKRSQNSALLPEVVFNVSYSSVGPKWKLAFQAAGKALDIRFTSDFILPASLLQRSLASASEKVRGASALWASDIPESSKATKETTIWIKRLDSLFIDADFDGAIVSLQGRQSHIFPSRNLAGSIEVENPIYGQYPSGDSVATATLRAPGVALKVRFDGSEGETPTLDSEIKVDASSNVLHPSVVPLIAQISSTVQDVVGRPGEEVQDLVDRSPKLSQGKSMGANDPTTILGRCKLNIGLWIRRQEFTMSCQPIARVAATASFDDVNITVNTVQSEEQRRIFAMLVAFNKLQASVKHVYSNESTASFDVDSIVVSMMNSKYVSSNNGISAILKISPTKLRMNAKQAQDFLLFRDIWMPRQDPSRRPTSAQESSPEVQAYMVQRYQQMASAGSFPWNSTVSIDSLDVQLDLGQTVGKSDFTIKDLWLSSKKTSDWEQNLCIGFSSIGIQNRGRLSGFVELSQFKIRTSIEWPDQTFSLDHTPLIQAAVGFGSLQAQVSFEYQPFLVVDVSQFDFLMYNVRESPDSHNDRLVSVLEGDKFHVFCTTLTASQGLALYQTLQRLIQEKRSSYESSLREIEKFLQRKYPLSTDETLERNSKHGDSIETADVKMPISLHTNVVVNLKAIKIGSFPSTFQDSQIFKLEALDAEARFSVAIEDGRIHSGLGLTLGQLRVALSSVNRPVEPGTTELQVADIVNRATSSRGGTILKVPRVVATMETWQTPSSNHIEYIFKSSFEGKVDVGWNYSRITFIRGMWSNHSRALASRLGKPLPQAAVKITGGPKGDDGEYSGQEKITAVVNVPLSRYTYSAIEPAVIETPQLRDMGEATPPLEWIGLQRDRLPHITHQIIIVTLMEIAKDVEDAYSKILGAS
ncbi:hypothetical protein FQN57_006050 [Myotisia sp. PD_48]|nr:hypothetical protein FQN57_006050 [Myotisia sp. PD_48]